jgi:hypothetical protein
MLDALKAVLWSFFGIRSNKGYDHDRNKLGIKQVILAGVFCVLVFILSLFFLVRFITAK